MIDSLIHFADLTLMLYGGDNKKDKKVRKKTSRRIKKLPSNKVITTSRRREDICREIFEELLNEEFPSCRPDWLKNPNTNRNLELDGYCEKLKLAFEYDGEQHFVYPNSFHKSKKEFVDQRKRDDLKERICKIKRIYLIRIPWYVKDLEQYIRDELSLLKIQK